MTNFEKWKRGLKAEHFLTHDFASFCDMFSCSNCPIKQFQDCLKADDEKEKVLKSDFMVWAERQATE